VAPPQLFTIMQDNIWLSYMSFFSKTIVFKKTTVFIKLVVSLTIINNNHFLRIVNNDPFLRIVYIFIIDNFFSKTIVFLKSTVFLKQFNKKWLLIVLIKSIVSKTNAICFLKVLNEWVVFKNDIFFQKWNDCFLKMIKKRNKNDRLTIVDHFQKQLTTLLI